MKVFKNKEYIILLIISVVLVFVIKLWYQGQGIVYYDYAVDISVTPLEYPGYRDGYNKQKDIEFDSMLYTARKDFSNDYHYLMSDILIHIEHMKREPEYVRAQLRYLNAEDNDYISQLHFKQFSRINSFELVKDSIVLIHKTEDGEQILPKRSFSNLIECSGTDTVYKNCSYIQIYLCFVSAHILGNS